MREKQVAIIRNSEQGSTTLEYAILAPTLFLMIIGIIEYDMAMYATSILNGALMNAAREGKTGYINSSTIGTCPSPSGNPQSQATYLNCLVSARLGTLFDTSKVEVTYNDTSSTTFNATTDTPTFPSGPCTNNPALVNLPTFPLCSENTQTAGDIVIYTVTYPWPIISPLVRQFLGSNGILTIQASTIVKNESYNVR